MTNDLRHLLDIDDLDARELAEILELAALESPPTPLAGKGVALLFEKPSLRTRSSSEMAVVALGGHPVTIRSDEVGIDSRESAEDIISTLAQYHSVVGARVFDHQVLKRMAEVGVVPIVNLLSDQAHPLQAIADLLTLRDHFGSLKGRKVAWVGDGNNVAASLALACARVDVEVAVATPPSHRLDPGIVEAVRGSGALFVETTSPSEAVAGADAVCTDVWVSMGEESQSMEKVAAFEGFRVDEALMAQASSDAVFLHCLPAHRDQEVAPEVIDGPSSLVWQQARNRLAAMRAVLLWITKGEW